MDAETKEYFEEFKKDIKKDFGRLEGKFDRLENKMDLYERKNAKAHAGMQKYLEHLDSELQEHWHNSEMHQKVAIG